MFNLRRIVSSPVRPHFGSNVAKIQVRFLPCYDHQGEDPTPQQKSEYNKTMELFDYVQKHEKLDSELENKFEHFKNHQSIRLGNDFSLYGNDVCTMRSLLAEYYVTNKKNVGKKLESRLLEELDKHQEHRVRDFEENLKREYKKIDNLSAEIDQCEDRIRNYRAILKKYDSSFYSPDKSQKDDLDFWISYGRNFGRD